jgi:hypothetical protein
MVDERGNWAACKDFYEFMLKICSSSVTIHDDGW